MYPDLTEKSITVKWNLDFLYCSNTFSQGVSFQLLIPVNLFLLAMISEIVFVSSSIREQHGQSESLFSQQKGAVFYHLTKALHFTLEQVLKLFFLVATSVSFEWAMKSVETHRGCDKGQYINSVVLWCLLMFPVILLELTAFLNQNLCPVTKQNCFHGSSEDLPKRDL